jgi:putative exporter of polyketide antibiotics
MIATAATATTVTVADAESPVLWVVDLAGSERSKRTGAVYTDSRQKEVHTHYTYYIMSDTLLYCIAVTCQPFVQGLQAQADMQIVCK